MKEETDKILERLWTLWGKLTGEGMYVRANTVALAIDKIKELEKEIRELKR